MNDFIPTQEELDNFAATLERHEVWFNELKAERFVEPDHKAIASVEMDDYITTIQSELAFEGFKITQKQAKEFFLDGIEVYDAIDNVIEGQ